MSAILLPIGQTLLSILTWLLAQFKRRGSSGPARVGKWVLLGLIVLVGALQVIQSSRAQKKEGQTADAILHVRAQNDTILGYVRSAGQPSAAESAASLLPAGLHYDLALSYRKWKERPLAEAQLRLALQADTSSAEMRATLGLVLGEIGLDLEAAGKKSEAIENWREAISLYGTALARKDRLAPVDAAKVQHWLSLAASHLAEISR